MKKLLLTFLFVFVLLTPARADYIYTYNYTPSAFSYTWNYGFSINWTYNSPNLLTETTTIDESALASWSTDFAGGIDSVAIDPALSDVEPIIFTYFATVKPQDTYQFMFGWGVPFNQVGTYVHPLYNATLTIAQTSAVPEPTTLLLLSLGLIGLAGARRK